MPITPFQKGVLHLLAANRQPEGHVAGGIAINRAPDSPRHSTDLKETWHKTAAQAEELFSQLPPEEIGSLYLKPDFSPLVPDPSSPDFSAVIRHFGSLRGAWPVLA